MTTSDVRPHAPWVAVALALALAACSAGPTRPSTSTPRLTVPAISAVSPTSGSTSGGTTVTVTGTGFTGVTKVVFGSAPSTGFTVVSDTRITANTPPGAAGIVDVVVTNARGASAVTPQDHFVYSTPGPTVASVAPTSGPTTGSTTVIISGSGFTGVTKVAFGTVAAAVTVVSDTKITALSPPQAVGIQDVTVTTPAGTSALSAADQFTYKPPPPTVTGVAPGAGTVTGGTTVTITGTGFTGATKVLFGTVAATSFAVVSDSRVTAVSPAEAAATHNVTVTTANGTSALTAADHFTFTAPVPVITSVAPSSGPASGGTTVTITGTAFTGATKVLFGTVAAAGFTVVSATRITALSPAQAAATRNITVTTGFGTNTLNGSDHFTYK